MRERRVTGDANGLGNLLGEFIEIERRMKESESNKKIIWFPRRYGRHWMVIKKTHEWQLFDHAWFWPCTQASGGPWIAYCAAEQDGFPDWYYVPSKPGKWSYDEAIAEFKRHCKFEEKLEKSLSGNDPCEVCKRLEIECKDCLGSIFCQRGKIR